MSPGPLNRALVAATSIALVSCGAAPKSALTAPAPSAGPAAPPNTPAATPAPAASPPAAANGGEPWPCPASNSPAPPCVASQAFERGTEVRETPLHGRRFIATGHLRRADGSTDRQLVIVDYSFSRNFHQKVHYPNRICALYVRADNDTERASVAKALDALAAGSDPSVSTAYQWALAYELPTNQDCFAAERDANGTLVAAEARWELRASGSGIAFVSRRWEGNEGATLFLLGAAEVSPRR